MNKSAIVVILWIVLTAVSCSFRREVTVQSAIEPFAGEMMGTWSGGVKGKDPLTVRSADLVQISFRGSHEAAAFKETVEYRSGEILYRAEISSHDASEGCTVLHEHHWDKGLLVKDWLRKVCDGEQYGAGVGN